VSLFLLVSIFYNKSKSLDIVLPIVKQVIGKYFRLRLIVSSGAQSEIQKSVIKYGLTAQHVDEVFAGEARNRASAALWLERRRAIEQSLSGVTTGSHLTSLNENVIYSTMLDDRRRDTGA
jgi:hypothetical protein